MDNIFVIMRPDGTPFHRDDAMGILATDSEAQAIRFQHAREEEGAEYVRYTRTQPPAAASMSERARVSKQVHDMLIDLRAAASIGRPITGDELHELEQEILRALEQALTQQRGDGEAVDRDAWAEALELPEGYTVEEFLPGGWHYAWTRADGERMVSGTTWNHPALAAIAAWQYAPDTTPQPSADAVRELVRRAYEVVHHDDECPAIGGCGDKDCRCDAVPFLRELESLLSGGSHA